MTQSWTRRDSFCGARILSPEKIHTCRAHLCHWKRGTAPVPRLSILADGVVKRQPLPGPQASGTVGSPALDLRSLHPSSASFSTTFVR